MASDQRSPGHLGRAVDGVGVQRSARHQTRQAPPEHALGTRAVLGGTRAKNAVWMGLAVARIQPVFL